MADGVGVRALNSGCVVGGEQVGSVTVCHAVLLTCT